MSLRILGLSSNAYVGLTGSPSGNFCSPGKCEVAILCSFTPIYVGVSIGAQCRTINGYIGSMFILSRESKEHFRLNTGRPKRTVQNLLNN